MENENVLLKKEVFIENNGNILNNNVKYYKANYFGDYLNPHATGSEVVYIPKKDFNGLEEISEKNLKNYYTYNSLVEAIKTDMFDNISQYFYKDRANIVIDHIRDALFCIKAKRTKQECDYCMLAWVENALKDILVKNDLAKYVITGWNDDDGGGVRVLDYYNSKKELMEALNTWKTKSVEILSYLVKEDKIDLNVDKKEIKFYEHHDIDNELLGFDAELDYYTIGIYTDILMNHNITYNFKKNND